MEILAFILPDGYERRLLEISAATDMSLDEIVRVALEHEYIMTEEQKEPLPFD